MNEAFSLAGQQIGLNERDQNAAISEYLKNGGQNLDPAVTAWCAAFVNSTLEQSGVAGTGKLNARSYMNWGEAVDQPQQGDVAVFSRGDPNGWQGHVGFYDGTNDDGSIRVLGGNQGDSVSIASYSADSLLGYRRAPGQPQPAPQNAMTPPQPAQPQQNALAAPQHAMMDPRAFMTPQNALGAQSFAQNNPFAQFVR
jgi:uncharacterized protein (TIGR02594 family)